MIIGHFSDLHGNLTRLLALQGKPDVWVNSGDLFPDCPDDPYLGTTPREKTRLYQKQWFHKNKDAFLRKLDGIPLITCMGNHDGVDLHKYMEHLHPTYRLTPEGFDLLGVRWAGFGETPLEMDQMGLEEMAVKTLASKPQILVTHAPPSGVLCGGQPSWGLMGMRRLLEAGGHTVKMHFFGHIHENGGTGNHQWGIQFVNGARNARNWIYDH